MHYWQKIYFSGSSTVVTLPRPLMHQLGLLPGDLLRIDVIPGEARATIEKLDVSYGSHRSPGRQPENPVEVKP